MHNLPLTTEDYMGKTRKSWMKETCARCGFIYNVEKFVKIGDRYYCKRCVDIPRPAIRDRR